jgi:hypothetical protein
LSVFSREVIIQHQMARVLIQYQVTCEAQVGELRFRPARTKTDKQKECEILSEQYLINDASGLEAWLK